MEKRSIILVLGLAGLVVLASGLIIWQMVSERERRIQALKEHWEAEATPEYNLTVVIKPYQYGKKKECKGVWREGITALDATKECDQAANLGLKLRYDPKIHKAYLIDEMLGLRHTEENNRYWLYYVNNVFITTKQVAMLEDPGRMYQGKKSEPMPERFYLKPGDRVEWRFEEWVTLEEEKSK